jgi:hypothetical protein
MKSVLDCIEQKKRELAQTPFLRFIEDASIDPRKRFAFVPCLAPFVMGFKDLTLNILRDDNSQHPVQQMINTHGGEEAHHFRMYLKDLRTLSLAPAMDMTDLLRMLWGDHCQQTRRVVYELTSLALCHTDPLIRLAFMEAIEGTADVSFDRFSLAAVEFEKQTGQRLHYFGMTHMHMEENHSINTDSAQDTLAAMELTAEQEQVALQVVARVYELFGMMFEELLQFAQQAEMATGSIEAARIQQLPVEMLAFV